ncbi:hypothetical protein B0H15DRAFT_1021709 [Mycena belliarum]|uniref:Uncharacterized protein n=1 Tax=Mycena belliarum TaxID=1033014 RepID=A0AAD6XNE6_9AGAR|nr:hypothetical protein B0H15DRAFT_1021709 [Mycena belliae]
MNDGRLRIMSNSSNFSDSTPRPKRRRPDPQDEDVTPRAPAPASRPQVHDPSSPPRGPRPPELGPLGFSPTAAHLASDSMTAKVTAPPKSRKEPYTGNLRSQQPWKSYVDRPPSSRDKQISVVDYLHIRPPSIPLVYEPGALSSTRALPNVHTLETKMGKKDRLLSVVPFGALMEPLILHARKKYGSYKLYPGNPEQRDWLVAIHPTTTSRFLPAVIRSESDSEDWVLNVMWRPALAGYWAAHNKTVRNLENSPNLTSCDGGGAGAILPDTMIWGPDHQLKATLEIKTHGAFISTLTPHETPTFDHIYSWPEMPPGYGIRFVWPASDDESNGTTKADKMIAQVWIQMVAKNVNYAALTNYSSVIFFVREGQTLYMSDEYILRVDDHISFAIFAFIAYIMGSNKDILKLPVEHENWWDKYDVGKADAPGLDHSTLPARLKEHLWWETQSTGRKTTHHT